MSGAGLPSVPPTLKPIQHYLKTAIEHDKRDPVIAYYCRLYALQNGMEIDKKSPDARMFHVALMDHLEKIKQENDDEAIHNEVVGQAHVENYAFKVFLFADNEDRAGRFNKNVVKSFYTAGMLFDTVSVFGELSDEVDKNRKYAKWKAAYIHRCLKNGETPIAGPIPEEGEDGMSKPEGSLYTPVFKEWRNTNSWAYTRRRGRRCLKNGETPIAGPIPEEGEDASGGVVPIGFEQPGPSQIPPGPSNYQPAPQSSSSLNLPGSDNISPGSGSHAPPTTPQTPQNNTAPPQQQQQQQPQTTFTATEWTPPVNASGVQLKPEHYQKCMKYCKYASSALQYEDSKTAIDNLTKALKLLTTGKDS